MNSMKYKTGFTLIEAMIVLVIIGLLAAMIVPAILKIRMTAQVKEVVKEVYMEYDDSFDRSEIIAYKDRILDGVDVRDFDLISFKKELIRLLESEEGTITPATRTVTIRENTIKSESPQLSDYEEIKLRNKVSSLESRVEYLERKIKELSERKY